MDSDRRYIDFRRPRGVADTINATFHFFREELGQLARSLVFVVVPFLLLSVLLGAATQARVWSGGFTAEQWLDAETAIGAAYLAALALGLLASVLTFAVVYAYGANYVEQPAGRIGPREVWQRLRRDALRFVGTILWFALIFVGLVLLNFIPFAGGIAAFVIMVYLSPVILLVFPARFDRKEAFWPALRRVRELVKGYWWKSFGLMIVTYLIVSMLSMGLTAAMVFLLSLIGSFLAPTLVLTLTFALMFGLGVVWYVLYAVPAVAFAIYYYGLAEDYDAPGLEAQIESMMATPGTVPLGG